jgi:hypothetical protein
VTGNGINTTRSLFRGRSAHNIFAILREGGGHGYKKEKGAKSGLEPLPSSSQGDADEIHTPVAWKQATLRPYAGIIGRLSPEWIKASQLHEIESRVRSAV